jgi:glycosyltransferase involved in cell wall biosynthesis
MLIRRSRQRLSGPEAELLFAQEGTGSQVTLMVTVYNYAHYVGECLASVRAQTLAGLDLVVVDDASTDRSPEVVGDWLRSNSARFARIRHLRHKRNSGPASARNTGFAACETPLVFVLDADNLLYPRCLAQLSRALEKCDASFSYCLIEKCGTTRGLQNLYSWHRDVLRYGNPVDAMVMLRRSVWRAAGGYTVNYFTRIGWEDFDLWFKIARLGGYGVQVPEILARYRVHAGSRSETTQDPHAGLLFTYMRAAYPEFWVHPVPSGLYRTKKAFVRLRALAAIFYYLSKERVVGT